MHFLKLWLMLILFFGLNPIHAQIDVQHHGKADAMVHIEILDPDSLTGDDYELTFIRQHYYLDSDGTWKKTCSSDSICKGFEKATDISRTRLSAAATYADSAGTVNIIATLDLRAPYGNYADGVQLKFPRDLIIHQWKPVWGAYGSFSNYNQNIINSAGTYDPITHSITWGDSARSTLGAIEGTVYLEINTDLFTPPLDIAYTVFDDGYDQNILDAKGTVSVDEIGYDFKTESQWDLKNSTLNTYVLADQLLYPTLEEPNRSQEVDGFRVMVSGTFDPPVNFSEIIWTDTSGIESIVGLDTISSCYYFW